MLWTILLLTLLIMPGESPKSDTFVSLPITDISFAEGQIPEGTYAYGYWRARELRRAMEPRVLLDSPGEAYMNWSGHLGYGGRTFDQTFLNTTLAVRSDSFPVKGRVLLPKTDLTGMAVLKFELGAPREVDEAARANFLRAKEEHYRRLLNREVPGGNWFRHQMREATRERTGKPHDIPEPRRPGNQWNSWRRNQLERTYDLFSGGRAIAENIQLERAMPGDQDKETNVRLDSLKGITIKEFDWKALNEGKTPETDPLAKYIPADQYALLFSSFTDMTNLMDEADEAGTPVIDLLEPRSENTRVKERYQEQLCLPLSDIARILGPQVIDSVAFTGSDPFLREGTDIALLFQAKEGKQALLTAYLASKQKLVAMGEGVQNVSGKVGDHTYQGVHTDDRRVSSFFTEIGDVVVIANSLAQLQAIAGADEQGNLAALGEYTFFRNRYVRGDDKETALLILPDAAIRKWCSPRWRIASSRRIRAAAVLGELQAANLEALVAGNLTPGPLQTDYRVLGGGEFSLTKQGVKHSIYGSPEFLTPIADLKFDHVTKQEAEFYERWRQGYERNWSNFFDPIAIRFTVQPEKVGVDVTVMPLILGSQYRDAIQLSRGASIAPKGGDPHKESLFHFAMALDPESRQVKQFGNFARSFSPKLGANPLSWLGETLAIYVDEDPIWKELVTQEDKEDYLMQKGFRLPIALWVEVKRPLILAAFLTSMRAFVQQSAPNMTTWESLDYNGMAYVRISASPGYRRSDEPEQPIHIYYATTPESLILTLDEGLLKRALDRQSGKVERGKHRTWLGQHYCLQAKPETLDVLRDMWDEDYHKIMQSRSWGNLPVLNEWKRLFPDKDPLQVHQKIFGTRLTCPGGGEFVWNEAWQTMASTKYGHPGEPKADGELPALLERIEFGNFGLTFEEDGLRARGELIRKK